MHHEHEHTTATRMRPPMMIKACTKMLDNLGVNNEQIAYDAF